MSSYNEIEDYELRKQFLSDLKILNKSEKEEIFRILKINNSLFSENSNGIFFDISKLSKETFDSMIKFMEFCKKNREEFLNREQEEKKAQDIINNSY